ncbi:MAG: biotin transporter BioY [Elusimicrobiales bacterium]|nr:biotin transporter BioY [Elusimicrobiales bacterium]
MEIALNRDVVESAAARRTIAVVFFLSATVMGAFVRIPLPFTPVPVTLQTFFVLLAGAYLGAGAGVSSQLLYVALGAAGAPIFAGAACGLSPLFGPTGGYLLGFAAAAFAIGALKRFCEDSFPRLLALFLLASFIILLCGTLWLKAALNLPAGTAFRLGMAPFIAGDLFKAIAACLVYWRFKAGLAKVC